MPQLEIMWISSDHTGGPPTAQAMQADNDLALGRFVDAISHSSIWSSSAIFVEEDDAQTGVDHVDGHRSPGYIFSPYVYQRVNPDGTGAGVYEDSTFYTQVNMTRTIEQILGLAPMNQFDLVASPMREVFLDNPPSENFLPWTHVLNGTPLAQGVSQTPTQTIPAAAPPFGNLEQALDAATGSTTVSQSDPLWVGGWVADKIDGAPLQASEVTVEIDGSPATGKLTLGLARTDVAAAQGSRFLDSGFTWVSSLTTPLSIGSHKITLVASDSAGRSTTFGPLAISVVASPLPTPFGNLEQALDASTGSTTVSQSDAVWVGGWVADKTDGAPLTASEVKVEIDGTPATGTLKLGLARTDVATAQGNQYLDSGYNWVSALTTPLSVGAHKVTVVATDSGGRSTTFGPLTITVVAAAAQTSSPTLIPALTLAAYSLTRTTDSPQVKALRAGWMQKKAEIFGGKYHIPDSEDPDTVRHYDWYEATGFKIPFPGEKTVRPASEFNKAAPAKADDDDDDN